MDQRGPGVWRFRHRHLSGTSHALLGGGGVHGPTVFKCNDSFCFVVCCSCVRMVKTFNFGKGYYFLLQKNYVSLMRQDSLPNTSQDSMIVYNFTNKIFTLVIRFELTVLTISLLD